MSAFPQFTKWKIQIFVYKLWVVEVIKKNSSQVEIPEKCTKYSKSKFLVIATSHLYSVQQSSTSSTSSSPRWGEEARRSSGRRGERGRAEGLRAALQHSGTSGENPQTETSCTARLAAGHPEVPLPLQHRPVHWSDPHTCTCSDDNTLILGLRRLPVSAPSSQEE